MCDIGGEFHSKIISPQLKQLAICIMMRENAASLHELLCDFPRFWNGTASGTNEMMRVDGFIEQKPATFPDSKHVTFPNAFSPIITDKLLQLLQFLDWTCPYSHVVYVSFAVYESFFKMLVEFFYTSTFYPAINQLIKKYWLHSLQQKESNYTLFLLIGY